MKNAKKLYGGKIVMKKRLFSIIFILCIMLSFLTVRTMAQEIVSVKFNGNIVNFDVPAQVINGRTMVPIRKIFELMGATVNWDASSQTAVCSKNDYVVKMTLNNQTMYINGQPVIMDCAAAIVDGRTLAPTRFVAEAFGYDVDWDENTNTVFINEPIQNKQNTPKYLSDFSVQHEDDSKSFSLFFAFKDSNGQYTRYHGDVTVSAENENGDLVFKKDYTFDESMFGSYTRTLTGNTEYILCEINILDSEITGGKTDRGIFKIDVSCGDVYWDTMTTSTYDLPKLSGKDLANIQYRNSFVLTKYYSTGRLWRRTNISSFEITNIEISYSGELKITYRVTGTVDGDDSCSFDLKCYDNDGFVLGTGSVYKRVSEGEQFRFEGTSFIPDGTVRIEFAD